MYEFAKDLYVDEADIRFYGFRLQTRMAVVRLSDERLLLYSPTWLTDEVRAQLDELGDVAFILSPNKIHNQTLREYADAYPEARVHVPPGLPERRPDLRVDAILADEASFPWSSDLDFVLTGGNVFFSEAVLFHRASRTLLVADLVENMDETTGSATALVFARLFGVPSRPVASPEFRLYTHDADAAARSFERIASWNFERIFLCHGRPIVSDAARIFREVVDDLLRAVEKRTPAARMLLRGLARMQ